MRQFSVGRAVARLPLRGGPGTARQHGVVRCGTKCNLPGAMQADRGTRRTFCVASMPGGSLTSTYLPPSTGNQPIRRKVGKVNLSKAEVLSTGKRHQLQQEAAARLEDFEAADS